MRKKRKKYYMSTKKYMLFLLFIIGIIILFVNDLGIIKLVQLKKQKYNLEQKLESLNNQQVNLRQTIHKLQHDHEYIEKIARERYMMVVPGEKVFRIAEEKHVQ